jgi:hypothetical protein
MTRGVDHASRLGLGLRVAAGAVLIALAFYRLPDYPTPWFDEGVHLHVPETLVRFGVYADRSSDGFRYFGPTLGVGPTVMLPIAGAFKLFGIGLVQARAVMALYLIATFFVFYRFARYLHGSAFAILALTLLVTSPSVAVVETGRQVLGEVPAFLMLAGGFWLWFTAWDGSWIRLTLCGLLLGASSVTKYQNLLVLVPTIGIAALLNLVYYRTARLRVFVWPGLVLGGVFGLWQVVLLLSLGPGTFASNFAALREATAGAAAAFSIGAMRRAVHDLILLGTYGGALALVLPYSLVRSLTRDRRHQQWGVLVLFAAVNFVWFVLASIGWLRYAFSGLALSSLFVARFILDLWGTVLEPNGPWFARSSVRLASLRVAIASWTIAVVGASLYLIARPIVHPPENTPVEMAAYLTKNVPTSSVVETWEPELGALTEHNYHYPPARLLNVAVRHIWLNGPSPSLQYHPLEIDRPLYVVVGTFARWVGVYPPAVLERDYSVIIRIGAYELYRRRDATPAVRETP